jgi:isopentenyl-diphosphate Delta-isomerase
MEQVEIVDEDLNILSVTSKKEAHEKGLLHKCVIAQVINSRGEIMLVKQLPHKQDAGQYVSPVGGHVSAGERDEDALKRETLEEIGLKDFTYAPRCKAIFNRKVIGRHENHYFILYEIICDDEPILGDESESYRWFTKEELMHELRHNVKIFGDAYLFEVEKCYPELLIT